MSTSPPGKLLAANEYAERYTGDEGFEDWCIRARQNCNLGFLRQVRPATILEVGCGPRQLVERAIAEEISFTEWTIVEPARDYLAAARDLSIADPRLKLVENYLESVVPELTGRHPGGFDCVLLSSILHETTRPLALLEASVRLLRKGGKILITVPNANSFHRLLAVEMGLISKPETVTERNRWLGQPIVFTPASLDALLVEAGLSAIDSGGYLFKPFTNEQMMHVVDAEDGVMFKGLEELGRRFPAHAAEIWSVAARH